MSDDIYIIDDPYEEPENPFPPDSKLGKIYRREADREIKETVLRWFRKMLPERFSK